MKKIITALTTLCIASTVSITAHADDILDKEYIASEIWEDVWLGKDDDGTEFPEASYKHHLLVEWIDDNYGSDEYDWSQIGELKYAYKDYYDTLTEDWDFNDDDNGNWTIETEDNSYRFELVSGTWNMIDENGDTVDMFPPFSTEEPEEVPLPNNNSNNSNRVIGKVTERTKMPLEAVSNESAELSEESSENDSQGISEGSAMNPLLFIAVVGAGAAFFVFRKKKK